MVDPYVEVARDRNDLDRDAPITSPISVGIGGVAVGRLLHR